MQARIKYNYVGETFSPVLESMIALSLEGMTDIEIQEASHLDAPLAFTLRFSYKERQLVRVLDGKYYWSEQTSPIGKEGKQSDLMATEVDWQAYFQEFHSIRPIEGKKTVLKRMEEKSRRLLIVDGLVYRRAEEPIYELEIMGNKFCLNLHLTKKDNTNMRGNRYSALEREDLRNEILTLLPSMEKENKNPFEDCFIEAHDEKYITFHRS